MRILAVGAHPDDIELGCAGTLLAHRARGDEVSLLVMTTGEQGPQAARSRVREQEDAARILGAELHWGGFPDGAVPDSREAIQAVERVIEDCGAGLIYCPSPQDTTRTTGPPPRSSSPQAGGARGSSPTSRRPR
jgi:LmbE family N-acetylglucosaminyl deacetylase